MPADREVIGEATIKVAKAEGRGRRTGTGEGNRIARRRKEKGWLTYGIANEELRKLRVRLSLEEHRLGLDNKVGFQDEYEEYGSTE